MPEAPEIWALHILLNSLGYKTSCYGKHLIYNDEDWSFGLHGQVHIDEDGVVRKLQPTEISGTIKECKSVEDCIQLNKLGLNWMTCNRNDVEDRLNMWKDSKKKLGTLLVDQTVIAGIGVTWGSEILYRCQLRPDIPIMEQNISYIPDAIIDIRNEIQKNYIDFILEQENLRDCVNKWFYNLYQQRNLRICGKGTTVKINNRNWWFDENL